jgi:DNA polymerase (family 10)
MDNRTAAGFLEELGDLIELAEDEPFKARAYHSAARTLLTLDEPAEKLLDEGRLEKVPGFGKALVGKLGELFKGGRIQYLDDLRAQVPPGLIEMRQVPGLGPKKVRMLFTQHGITSLSVLEAACHDGTLEKLSGFGAKTVAKIADGIKQVRSFAGQWRFPQAERVSQRVQAMIEGAHPGAVTMTTGAVRRNMEIIDSLSWVVQAPFAPDKLVEAVRSLPECRSCDPGADGTLALTFTGGVSGKIHFVSKNEFARMVLSTTGPVEYAEFVFSKTNGPFALEDEMIRAAGLPVISPECRDVRDFWTAGTPKDLLTYADLRGVLHCHSTYSDGLFSLAEMAAACRARGFAYFGICDHSQSAGYAGGLNPHRVREQHEEIDRLNAEYGGEFRIFKGIESDIRVDGSLDYPEDILKAFDFVVASVHSQLDMDEKTATERTCRALSNPFTTILGHSTGRLLLTRNGFPLDWPCVIETAAKHGVVIELNANPQRLDIDWRLLPQCLTAGVMTSINPDAHRTDTIDEMRYGVGVARKAGVTPKHVLNCMTRNEIEAYFAQKRE